MVGAFAPNKRVDLAVKAFNRLKLPLKIVGSGQDEEYCRSIAGENIEFLGDLSSEKLVELYQQARAFLFPGEDDFGITPLEAQACNTPVIAFASGGAMETVTEQTGLFFSEQKVDVTLWGSGGNGTNLDEFYSGSISAANGTLWQENLQKSDGSCH